MESEQFSKIFSFAAPEGATQFFGGAPLGVPSKNCAKLVFYEIATTPRSVPEPAARGRMRTEAMSTERKSKAHQKANNFKHRFERAPICK